jgi:hypothetical protein
MKVGNLADAVLGQKARQEDVGVRQIELLVTDAVGRPRRDLEPAALVVVEHCCE